MSIEKFMTAGREPFNVIFSSSSAGSLLARGTHFAMKWHFGTIGGTLRIKVSTLFFAIWDRMHWLQ